MDHGRLRARHALRAPAGARCVAADRLVRSFPASDPDGRGGRAARRCRADETAGAPICRARPRVDLWTDWRSARLGRDTLWHATGLIAGALIPLAVLCVVFAAQGVLDRFWFWTFQYARQYVSEVPIDEAWPAFQMGWRDITQKTWPIWWLAGLGIVAVWFGRWPTDRAPGHPVCRGVGTDDSAGLLLPAALLHPGAAGGGDAQRHLRSRAGSRVLTNDRRPARTRRHGGDLRGGARCVRHRRARYLFRMPVRDLSRSVYGEPVRRGARDREVHRIADDPRRSDRRLRLRAGDLLLCRAQVRDRLHLYLRAHGAAAVRLADAGRDDARDRSRRPQYVVAVLIGTSWLARPGSDQRIIAWFQRYMTSCYEQVGLVDIHSVDRTTILWEAAGPGYKPQSQNLVAVYKRTGSASCKGG